MKRTVLALTFAAALALLGSGPAYASCTFTTIYDKNGNPTYCETCCYAGGTSCYTKCF